MSARATQSKETDIEAARQRVCDAEEAYREGRLKVRAARTLLRKAMREADAAVAYLRQAERKLEAAREVYLACRIADVPHGGAR